MLRLLPLIILMVTVVAHGQSTFNADRNDCVERINSMTVVGTPWFGHDDARLYSNMHDDADGLNYFLKRFSLVNRRKARGFNTEVRALRAFPSHPYIASLVCYYRTKDYGYILTESLTGSVTLMNALSNSLFPLQPDILEEEALFVVYQLRTALDHLHAHKVYHNDIKPQNMLYNKKGQIKLIDFDMACTEHAKRCPIGGTWGFYNAAIFGYFHRSRSRKLSSTADDLILRQMRSNVNDYVALAASLTVMGNAASKPKNWRTPLLYGIEGDEYMQWYTTSIFPQFVSYILDQQNNLYRDIDDSVFWNNSLFKVINEHRRCRSFESAAKCHILRLRYQQRRCKHQGLLDKTGESSTSD